MHEGYLDLERGGWKFYINKPVCLNLSNKYDQHVLPDSMCYQNHVYQDGPGGTIMKQ